MGAAGGGRQAAPSRHTTQAAARLRQSHRRLATQTRSLPPAPAASVRHSVIVVMCRPAAVCQCVFCVQGEAPARPYLQEPSPGPVPSLPPDHCPPSVRPRPAKVSPVLVSPSLTAAAAAAAASGNAGQSVQGEEGEDLRVSRVSAGSRNKSTPRTLRRGKFRRCLCYGGAGVGGLARQQDEGARSRQVAAVLTCGAVTA
ncbi:hypothetical protein E2C01_100159 [Portunus trituberculatus]|uniref:Uncharacterized protein n=1 Tax=Portunus trituberculatus TaxID=210409 RepID=A0A5B7KH87_PORTR|nr:hypothetical protein [Portunus trituberculatus]